MMLRSLLVVSLLAGCTSTTQTPEELSKTDSLLLVSDSVAARAERSGKLLDSVTTATAEKVTSDVKELNETIDKYEVRIKSAVKVQTTEKIIHDTVYIETKKSFWGRTKTNITTKSDSSINQSEVVDTTQL